MVLSYLLAAMQLPCFSSGHFVRSLPLASIVSITISLSYPPTLPVSVHLFLSLFAVNVKTRKSKGSANSQSLEQCLFRNKYSEIITIEPAAPPIRNHQWGRSLKLYAFQIITLWIQSVYGKCSLVSFSVINQFHCIHLVLNIRLCIIVSHHMCFSNPVFY